jgi:tetratricopeptide (TPR) repeat protein
LNNNTNLQEALLWADSATSTGFGGDQSFAAWSTKAGILDKLGKSDEAAAVMKKALPLATMQQIHNYGRSLLTQKKYKEALEIFKMNFDKNPNQFTTLMGMMRGYSANGDYTNALKYAQQALPLAPNQQNKSAVETAIQKLKDGKDVN